MRCMDHEYIYKWLVVYTVLLKDNIKIISLIKLSAMCQNYLYIIIINLVIREFDFIIIDIKFYIIFVKILNYKYYKIC